MVIFYKKFKKYNEIQLTKNKMDWNSWKMTNHPLSPVFIDNVKSDHLYVVCQTNNSNDTSLENAGISGCHCIRIKNNINNQNFLKKHAAQVTQL